MKTKSPVNRPPASEDATAPAAGLAPKTEPAAPQCWPAPIDFERFYGPIEIGADGEPTDRWEARALIRLSLPLALPLAWRPESAIRRLRCSRRVHHSLSRIFVGIHKLFTSYSQRDFPRFAGCYRPLGAAGDLHAWGAAFRLESPRLAEIAPLFTAEGWTFRDGAFLAARC